MKKTRREDFDSIEEYYSEYKYEEFYQFLGCYFAVTCPGEEKKTDLERIQDFLKNNGRDSKVTQQTIKEGRKVLKFKPFPWEWVTNSANGYSCSEEDEKKYSDEELCRQWTKQIIDTLEEEAIKAGKLQAQKKAG